MRFTLAIATLIAAVAAAPSGNKDISNQLSTMTWGEAADVCGKDLEVSCCNKKSADKGSGNGLLNGLSLLDGCSKLGVGALVGLNDLLNQGQCKQTVACCQHTNSEASVGLINVGLPCLALGSLL